MRFFTRPPSPLLTKPQKRSAVFIPRAVLGLNARSVQKFLVLLVTGLALTVLAITARAADELSAANLYGTNFTVSVPNVEAGDYTAILGFMETDATGAGQRVFD